MSEVIKNKEHLEASHDSLESEIRFLAEEVKRKTRTVENPESDQVKEVIKDTIRDGESVLPSYLDDMAPEVKLKIEKLADGVFHKGLKKTLVEAKKEGPFFLDALHDVLSDKLYDEMKKRELI